MTVYVDDMHRYLARQPHSRASRGHNLACWCGLCDAHRASGRPLGTTCPDCAPCHADLLLEIANA